MSPIEAKSIHKCLKYNLNSHQKSRSASFGSYLSYLSTDFASIWVILKPRPHLNDLQAHIRISNIRLGG